MGYTAPFFHIRVPRKEIKLHTTRNVAVFKSLIYPDKKKFQQIKIKKSFEFSNVGKYVFISLKILFLKIVYKNWRATCVDLHKTALKCKYLNQKLQFQIFPHLYAQQNTHTYGKIYKKKKFSSQTLGLLNL